MLRLENITKVFGAGTPDEVAVFQSFDFAVDKGEFISVIGSNGSGKTTLLNLICGFERPESGKILFKGLDITPLEEHRRARFIGRVFQDPKAGTCGNLTILENMALADNKNRSYGLGAAVNKKRIGHYKTLLEECGLGLENRLNAPAGTLSGGQRQALAMVIAGMTDIELLILDEHTAALDPKSSENIMALTDRLIKGKGITTLMVTHNLKYALSYGTRLVMLHAGNRVLDLKGDEKKNMKTEDLLSVFNRAGISAT